MSVKDSINLGGFCGLNSGYIADSYSISELSQAKNKGGFCFKNIGEIHKCFSVSSIKKRVLNTFCHENDGVITYSFNGVENNSQHRVSNIHVNNSVNFCDFSDTKISELKEILDLDFNNYWHEANDSDNLISLELKSDCYDCSQYVGDMESQAIFIRTKEDLFSISDKIKNGDVQAASSYYILENDINLKGKSWDPIGTMLCPFSGIFDGNGHKIYNFKVTDREIIFAGFFGVIENALIANLQVDGIIKTGKYSGGFVGMSKNSKIYSCSAVAQVIGKDIVGGFVGNNNKGIIEGCYFNGKIKKPFPLAWIMLIPLLIAIILICLYVLNPMKNKSTFNNVPIDPYSAKSTHIEPYKGGQNKASFSFSDVVEFIDGKADVKFGSIDSTNQSMTIKIQITDQELVKKIGKTGRTSKEQAELDSNENYDPSNMRVTISESGLVLPGYNLKKLVLNTLPDGTKLPNGIYSGIAFLNFFNSETNEKAIVNSQIPVAVVIK